MYSTFAQGVLLIFIMYLQTKKKRKQICFNVQDVLVFASVAAVFCANGHLFIYSSVIYEFNKLPKYFT
uniref:Uncharacterized protein n=1 Tax=Anguilla anguilla TaxID=7936 RepID=A0A0E9W8T4_ANGAN